MSSPLPPLPTFRRSNSTDKVNTNRTNSLDAPLTPNLDVDATTSISTKETSTTPKIIPQWHPHGITINIASKDTKSSCSRNNSTQLHLTPLTPIEYDDKLEYTPPSLNHMHIDTIIPSLHKPDFSISAASTSTNNTMKTKLTLDAADSRNVYGFNIEPQCLTPNISNTDLRICNLQPQRTASSKRTQSQNMSSQFSINNLTTLHSIPSRHHTSLQSIGFSPFDPTDINAIHPNEVEKALNIIHTTELQTTNSFQKEHIAAFAKQSHSVLNRRISGTNTSTHNNVFVSETKSHSEHTNDDKMRSVPCSEGCGRNICLNIDYWNNKYNIFRMFMLCVVIVFIIVCILYAIGQLLRLELDDYLCDNQLDIHDIHRHNQAEYLPQGDVLSCWRTENGIINEGELYTNKDIVYKAVFEIDLTSIVKMLSFIIIGTFLSILVLLVHCIQLYNDVRRFYFNAWVYIYFKQKRAKSNGNKKTFEWTDIIRKITDNGCIKLYRTYFSADRIGWVFYLMLREIVEVFIQTMALLSYGGYTHGLDTSDGEQEVMYLAEKPVYIIIFSVFLTMNCLTVGIIWCLYICCHDSFQGRYFNGVILMIDSIFDIFYSFFPLIIRNHYGAKDLLFFSSFQSYSLIGYLSMLIPLIFLSSKMFTVLNFLSSKSRKDWRLLFDERLWYKMQRKLARVEPHKHDSLSQMQIKTNPALNTQHAFTIRHGLADVVIQESPEEEAAQNGTPVSDLGLGVVGYTPTQTLNDNEIPHFERHTTATMQTPVPTSGSTQSTPVSTVHSLDAPHPHMSMVLSDTNTINTMNTEAHVHRPHMQNAPSDTNTRKSVTTFSQIKDRNHLKSIDESNEICIKHFCTSLCYGPRYLQSPLPDRRFSPSKFCIQVLRRAVILMYGIILIIYGVILIVYISHHFRISTQVCSNEDNTGHTHSAHPELQLWKYCTHKVYPFVMLEWEKYALYMESDMTHYPCQCRSFFMSSNDFIESSDILLDAHNGNIFSSLLEQWWMLQMIVLHNDANIANISIRLNSTHNIRSSALRIVSMRNINVEIDDDSIFSIWRSTEFFQIDNGYRSLNGYFPATFSEWNNLKYLSLIGSDIFGLDNICNFHKLSYLSLQNNSNLVALPFDCMIAFEEHIRYINLVNCDVFNASFMVGPRNLRQYIHYFGDVGVDDLADIDLVYHENTAYYLHGTQLCSDYRMNVIESEKIIKWIEESEACDLPFDTYDLTQLSVCPPMKWMNGICDDECNNRLMLFDAGDCTQLCNFDECDILKSWMDQECDDKCNQTQCLYDQYQCVNFKLNSLIN